MITIVFIWLIISIIFVVFGFSIQIIINKLIVKSPQPVAFEPVELFFMGFLILSVISGFVSIVFPVGTVIFLVISMISLILLVVNYRGIILYLKGLNPYLRRFGKLELVLFSVLLLFILTAVVQKITLGDTESYHAQSIQWVRKFAVVPGLGNIHGRLAFNSMFFIVSGLFTIQSGNMIIYPLNGLCYLVLVYKLSVEAYREFNHGTRWITVFYLLILLVSMLMLLPDLNSPAPDVICTILVVYSFVVITSGRNDQVAFNTGRLLLLNLVVFCTLSFKLSSLFLVLILLFTFRKMMVRSLIVSVCVAFLTLTPFLVRNYFLSGYLVYPYPSADFFNPDWKIPVNDVADMKMEIERWARVGSIPPTEVNSQKYSEWIPVWFKELNSNKKLLLIVNFFGLFNLFYMLLRKDYFFLSVHLIILLNLLFWIMMAPDPRFSYGFLFLGFALTFSYLTGIAGSIFHADIFKYVRLALFCFLIIVAGRRIMSPVGTLMKPSRWVVPDSFETPETNEYFSGFKYRVPVNDVGCFNADIPCVPYELENIVMRGKGLQEGFKINRK